MEKDQQELFVSTSPEARSAKQIIQLQADLIELAHDAILVRDPASRIIAWNRGARDLYGWSEEEALGQVTHTFLQTRFPESPQAVELALEQRGYWEGQLTHISRDGTPRIVDSHQVIVHSQSGQGAAVLEVNRDITEQIQLQHEYTQAQATEMALRETTRRMDTFLSIISHELKTPLTAAKGNVQLAKRQITRLLQAETERTATEMSILSALQTFIDRTERQIDTQNRLVDDLIDVSRIQSNQLNLQIARYDLIELVQRAIDEWRILAPTRAIQWTSSLSHAEVLVDDVRIAQVVNNYLSNALKYSEASTPVVVWVEREDTNFRFSVRDQGSGLSPEQQEHIWDHFFRVEEIEVRSGSGTSLGLYICRNLIERQGGGVGMESRPGKGSTFWFTLPPASSETQEE